MLSFHDKKVAQEKYTNGEYVVKPFECEQVWDMSKKRFWFLTSGDVTIEETKDGAIIKQKNSVDGEIKEHRVYRSSSLSNSDKSDRSSKSAKPDNSSKSNNSSKSDKSESVDEPLLPPNWKPAS